VKLLTSRVWTAGLAVVAQISLFGAQVSTFDVASVKSGNPLAGPHVVSLIINHGRLNIEAAELRQIVGLAYAVQRIRVLGGPGWADSDQFDIAAIAERADASDGEVSAGVASRDEGNPRILSGPRKERAQIESSGTGQEKRNDRYRRPERRTTDGLRGIASQSAGEYSR
jgi:hypothetical protein